MKKLISVITATAMVASVMVGCVSGGNTVQTTAATTAAQAAAETTAAPAAAPAPAAKDATVVSFAVEDSTSAVSYKAMEVFEKEFEEATDGRFDVQLFPDAQLGSENEVAEGIAMGSVTMELLSGTNISTWDNKFSMFELPFLFTDWEDANAAYDSELGDIYNTWTEEYGVHCAGFYASGFRATWNNIRPVRTPEDMKGLKLRVINSDMFINLFTLLGANPTPMNWNEIYTGLEQGTIDGQDNPPILTYDAKFYEKLKYMTATNHVCLSVFAAVNNDFYQGLSDEDRAAFDKAADDMIAYARENCKKADAEALEKCKAAGVECIELTEDEMKAFKECVTPIYDQYRDIVGSDVMDKLLS